MEQLCDKSRPENHPKPAGLPRLPSRCEGLSRNKKCDRHPPRLKTHDTWALCLYHERLSHGPSSLSTRGRRARCTPLCAVRGLCVRQRSARRLPSRRLSTQLVQLDIIGCASRRPCHLDSACELTEPASLRAQLGTWKALARLRNHGRRLRLC